MPINQTADLLSYFNQNTPNNSQIAPVNVFTYPPIPGGGLIGATMPLAPLSGMNINALNTPYTTLPVSGMLISPISAPYSTAPISGMAISPLAAPYSTAPISGMSIPTNITAPFSQTSTLLALGAGVSTPPNNLTSIPPLVDNIIPPLTVKSFFIDTYAPGFTTNRQGLDPSQYIGIAGQPGAMTYIPPTVLVQTAEGNNFNATTKYKPDLATKTRFGKITDGAYEIPTTNGNKTSLYSLYKAGNYSAVKMKFDSFVKPYVTRGIQKDTPDYARVDGIPESADEHMERLTLAIDGSTWMGGFKNRRKKMQLYQMQSRFQLGLGILPLALLPLGHPYKIDQGLDLRKTDILSMASAKAWIKAGTIARVPYSLIDYSVLQSLGFKYGLGGNDIIWKALNSLYSLLGAPGDDLVPFYFKIMHMDNPPKKSLFSTAKADGEKDVGWLQFRGTIKTLSHSVTPQWSSKKYFGRPDSVHTYASFGQNFSFSFQVYAASRGDMKSMYEDINTLVSMTKPGWEKESYMVAPVTELTIGDYVKDQPGFISSLSISPDEQLYWDMGRDPIKGIPQIAQLVPQGLIDQVPLVGANPPSPLINNSLKFSKNTVVAKKLPRAFNISITYTVIEKEIPNANGKAIWETDTIKGWL